MSSKQICENCGSEIDGQWHGYGGNYYHPQCDPTPERAAKDCPEFLKDDSR